MKRIFPPASSCFPAGQVGPELSYDMSVDLHRSAVCSLEGYKLRQNYLKRIFFPQNLQDISAEDFFMFPVGQVGPDASYHTLVN